MEINNQSLVMQMKIMAAQARGEAESIINTTGNTQGFSDVFKSALNEVNQLQQNSAELKQKYTLGDPTVSLVDTMVASQKSSLAFEATLQVRNKLVQAYKDIMSMPI